MFQNTSRSGTDIKCIHNKKGWNVTNHKYSDSDFDFGSSGSHS